MDVRRPITVSQNINKLQTIKLSVTNSPCGSLAGSDGVSRSRHQQRCVRLIFVILLASLVLPASLNAKPGYRVHPGGVELTLPIERRGIYLTSVSANDRQRVQLTVERPSSTTEYSTKGRVSSRRIEADFGALGRVDVRLDLVRFRSAPSRKGRCRGPGPLYGLGTYRGMIEVAHRVGVPEVSIRRGRVYFERLFRQVCKRRSPRFKPGSFPKLKRQIEEGVLTVHGKGGGRTVRMEATIFAFRRNPAQSGGMVSTRVYERHEGVRITRWTGDFFDRGSFVMSKRGKTPETIDVALPEPFAGRALYLRSSGFPPSWAGNLSIDLPGANGIPLVGPGFSATLCRARVDGCLYGRSHSQPGQTCSARPTPRRRRPPKKKTRSCW